MGATNAPFGMKAIRHPSGQIRAVRGSIATGATAIYKNSPVRLAATGTITVAAAGESLLGAFVGCQFTAGGKMFIQNYFPNAQATTDAIGWYYDDPLIVYAMQADGSVALADIGSQADLTSPGTGSTVTGISSATFSATPVTSGTSQIQVLGLYGDENNAWGDAYTVCEIMIVEHQLAGNRGDGF